MMTKRIRSSESKHFAASDFVLTLLNYISLEISFQHLNGSLLQAKRTATTIIQLGNLDYGKDYTQDVNV